MSTEVKDEGQSRRGRKGAASRWLRAGSNRVDLRTLKPETRALVEALIRAERAAVLREEQG